MTTVNAITTQNTVTVSADGSTVTVQAGNISQGSFDALVTRVSQLESTTALAPELSDTASKRPIPASMADGQLAINTNATSPGLFFKDAGGALIKVGPVHVGTSAPNSSPAAGGSTGNAVGEQWLDTSDGGYVLKIWDGSAWRSEVGEFVDAAGDTMTGALILPSGTAAAPALGVGSTDNGIYSPGTDQVAISTNGTGRLFVDSSGRVGIGNSPWTGAEGIYLGQAGHIYGVGTNSVYYNTNAYFNSGWKYNGNSAAVQIEASGGTIKFNRAPINSSGAGAALTWAESLRITSDGKLGLGTSSPSANLHVQSTSGVGSFILEGGSAYALAALVANGAGTNYIASNVALQLQSSNTAALHIDSSQRVGIGTTTPGTNFHLNTNPPWAAPTGGIPNNTQAWISSPQYAGLGIQGSSAGSCYLLFSDESDGDVGYVAYSHVDDTLRFGVNAGERARIDSSGRLLVGTSTSANNPRLGVAGSIHAGAGPNRVTLGAGATGTIITPARGYSYVNISASNGTTRGLLLLLFASTTTLEIVSTIDNNSLGEYSASVSGRDLQITNTTGGSKTYYASCMTLVWGDNG